LADEASSQVGMYWIAFFRDSILCEFLGSGFQQLITIALQFTVSWYLIDGIIVSNLRKYCTTDKLVLINVCTYMVERSNWSVKPVISVRRSKSKTWAGVAGGRDDTAPLMRMKYLRYWDEFSDFYRVRIRFGRMVSIFSWKFWKIGLPKTFKNSQLGHSLSESSRVWSIGTGKSSRNLSLWEWWHATHLKPVFEVRHTKTVSFIDWRSDLRGRAPHVENRRRRGSGADSDYANIQILERSRAAPQIQIWDLPVDPKTIDGARIKLS
jgi:hypothetical protein